MSADWSAIPVPVPYANFTNPQTLNLYAIVHDNPETFADLDGHAGDENPAVGGPTNPANAAKKKQKKKQKKNPPPPPPKPKKSAAQRAREYFERDSAEFRALVARHRTEILGQIGFAVFALATDGAGEAAEAGEAGEEAVEVGKSASEALKPTAGQVRNIAETAAQGGREAVEKALRSFEKRLAEHLAKLGEITGDPGSVQREITNFRGLIEAAKDWLAGNP